MKAHDKIRPRGIVRYNVYKNDRLVYTDVCRNLVVAGGRSAIAALVGGNIGNSPNRKFITTFGVGTNGNAPVDADTALTGAFTKALDSKTYPSTGVVQANFVITTGEANGMAIQEFGLYCEDGTLFARKVVNTINKTSSIRIEGSWQIIF